MSFDPECNCEDVQGELHSCPYDEEINDGDLECDCCSICESECAMDI